MLEAGPDPSVCYGGNTSGAMSFIGDIAMNQAIRQFANIRKLALAIATMLLFITATASAEVIPLNLQATGAFVTQGTPIDTNGDGKTAHLLTAQGQGPRFGRVTYHAVAEFSTGASPAMCPNGNPGAQQTLLTGAIVSRVENGDLVHSRIDSGTACFDPVTRLIFVRASASIRGGTGEFRGASGNVSIVQSVTNLIGDPNEGGAFGSAVSIYRGTIITQQ
jgi:hypothetical protein